MSLPGWEELPSAPAAEADLIEGLAAIPTSVVADAVGRICGTTALRPFHRDPRPFAGTAVTVHTRAGDNLAVYRAFAYCRPGDVLVVDGGGDITQALLGEIMTSHLAARGIAAVVVDGAVRDVEALGRSDFPVYARGVTFRGPFKTGPGRINVPVVLDRSVVLPGDVLVGDANGLIALRPVEAAEVLRVARGLAAKEEAILDAVAEQGLDLAWVAPRTKQMQG